jgi:hypothetical protein
MPWKRKQECRTVFASVRSWGEPCSLLSIYSYGEFPEGVGAKCGLDLMARRKTILFFGNLLPILQPTASCCTAWIIPAHCMSHLESSLFSDVPALRALISLSLSLIRHRLDSSLVNVFEKRKAILVTGLRCPYDCETSRLPYFLDNRLTDGVQECSLTRLPAALYPQEDSWCSFLLEAESTPGS